MKYCNGTALSEVNGIVMLYRSLLLKSIFRAGKKTAFSVSRTNLCSSLIASAHAMRRCNVWLSGIWWKKSSAGTYKTFYDVGIYQAFMSTMQHSVVLLLILHFRYGFKRITQASVIYGNGRLALFSSYLLVTAVDFVCSISDSLPVVKMTS